MLVLCYAIIPVFRLQNGSTVLAYCFFAIIWKNLFKMSYIAGSAYAHLVKPIVFNIYSVVSLAVVGSKFKVNSTSLSGIKRPQSF